ncbi:MAG TPA: MmcQ/YjbR family DNA-binding protein [Myxococcota bacterium]|nr:MmcQ/YjbR family DNA-binding protein [Myxococcota bacterium]
MKSGRAAKRGVTWDAVRRLVLAFPGVSEGTSYGMPAFLLDGKFFSRFNEKEEGLVVHADVALRDTLLAGRPDVYFTTDHYRGYPYVLVRLARIPRAELAALLENAFRAKAKAHRVAEYDARRTTATK